MNVFVSSNRERRELYELLLAQSRSRAPFRGVGRLRALNRHGNGSERVRRRIREADQVSSSAESTRDATRMSASLLTPRRTNTLLLLWGRRDIMCTKPIGPSRGGMSAGQGQSCTIRSPSRSAKPRPTLRPRPFATRLGGPDRALLAPLPCARCERCLDSVSKGRLRAEPSRHSFLPPLDIPTFLLPACFFVPT